LADDTVAVTGGCGRLGTFVVDALVDGGHSVRVIDRSAWVGRQDVVSVQADVLDLGQVVGALAGAATVIHLAAVPRPGITTDDILFATNVLGTFNVHEAARLVGVGRVVSTSSTAALGWQYRERDFAPAYLPVDEAHPVQAQDAYALSKQVGEAIAESYAGRGLETIVIRPPWVVSPEVLDELRASNGREVSGFTLADYIDVRDLADAYRCAVDAEVDGCTVLHVVADDSVISEPLSTYLPKALPEIGGMASCLTGTSSSISNAKAKQVLGWKPARTWRPNTTPRGTGQG
jgi:nucleoside-diphosphate-sugar epimerase